MAAQPNLNEEAKLPTKILVVDDEVDNLDLLRRTFRRDYDVFTANSAKEALRILAEHEFAVIVSDQRMPEMTGVELFREAHEKYPHTIRILLTGYTDINALVDAINMGHVYRYITKPWSREDIILTIKRAVEHYNTSRENALLLQELSDKNIELQKSYKELKRLDNLKTKFMVISSHELRTPASIISGNLELVVSGAIGEVSPDQNEILNNAYKGTLRLIELIEDVLAVLRIEGHKLTLRLKEIDLNKLIGEVIQEIKVFVDDRNQTIVNEVPNVVVLGDENRLAQMLFNVLSNAVKYSKDGDEILVGGSVEGEHVHLFFRDPGIGIASAELEKIFEKFYQLGDADQHRSSKFKFMGGGSGLGLTIVKGIVDQHKGKVWAESAGADLGTTIHIMLPLVQNADS